jgi:hypothetical protein
MEPVPDQETAARLPGDAAVDVPTEVPEDDAAEQAFPAVDDDDIDDTTDVVLHRGLEVDEADAAEQARTVTIDDSEER